jgi:hypothetical protein
MKNPIYTIKNRTRDLPACIAGSQATAPSPAHCVGGWVVFRAVLYCVEGSLLHLSGIEPHFSVLRPLATEGTRLLLCTIKLNVSLCASNVQ